MKQLKQTKDPQIITLLNRLTPDLTFQYTTKAQAEFYGPNKPRFVDPWVEQDDKLVKLSAITQALPNTSPNSTSDITTSVSEKHDTICLWNFCSLSS